MYWALGSPRVFAEPQVTAPEQTQLSHDGLEEQVGPHRAGRPPNATRNSSGVRLVRDGISNGVRNSEQQADHTRANESRSPDIAGENGQTEQTGSLLGSCITRDGQYFITWTATSFSFWQAKPTVVVAQIERSRASIKQYGSILNIHIRPDSAILVVHTSKSFLITYTIAIDPSTLQYQGTFSASSTGARRRNSVGKKYVPGTAVLVGPGEGRGIPEVTLRFRMVISVSSGISKALALEDELIVATKTPPAIQCIRWAPENNRPQTSNELLARMPWIAKHVHVQDVVYDRPMSLFTWTTTDGKAYAVQRISPTTPSDPNSPRKLFQGYCFHEPRNEDYFAIRTAVNARFSLIAVGCANGDILIYSARDYAGHIPLSHTLSARAIVASTSQLNHLSWSPDGYCIFAGYSNGWMTWSVYGKLTGNSFQANREVSDSNKEDWLLGVKDAFWLGNGSSLVLLGMSSPHFSMLEMARSAIVTCLTPANITRSLVVTGSAIMIYRGYDVMDVSAISAESGLWHQVQIPSAYLLHQWPVRSTVISPDGRYVAVAGRRGLAHYSVTSGRWKTFDDPVQEDSFTVRGGMCWHHHILVAAVETNSTYQIRMYSRELALDNGQVLHAVTLSAPIVLISPSGEDSLLVYTYENILYHYMITNMDKHTRLVQVGQIALHGIIRAPLRVRAVSWVLPEEQLENGDPSQDVALAAILFLVDAKLVLLNPATSEQGELKYEMRILAENVEHYSLMRDQPVSRGPALQASTPKALENGLVSNGDHLQDLKDSVWFFDGQTMKVWPDMQDVLASAYLDFGRELPPCVDIPLDFYPLSTVMSKGILLGVEPEVLQRSNVKYSTVRFVTRTHLFLPALLKYHLSRYNSPAALHLSDRYRGLGYFPHALEVLLHDVLDEEVDLAESSEQRLLPNVLSFLSSFPEYLDIVVQCTRKTEVRSWRTLFAHLPPPRELFEESLAKGSLKTAGGYLLVLHHFDELSTSSDELVRLLRRAKDERDWELCKELARFLMALDQTGDTLARTLRTVDLLPPAAFLTGEQAATIEAA